jgi:hypothetical protein
MGYYQERRRLELRLHTVGRKEYNPALLAAISPAQ